MRLRCLWMALVTTFSTLCGYQYELSICSMFQNEAPYLGLIHLCGQFSVDCKRIVCRVLLLGHSWRYALVTNHDIRPFSSDRNSDRKGEQGPYLREWIEFHRIVGVTHFWLYNNNSQDDYLQVLQPYMDKGIVELRDWPSPLEDDWTRYQNAAYADCLSHCIGRTKWLAVIDIDEFIVPTTRRALVDTLRRLEQHKGVGGLMLFWQFFGTSYLHDIPADRTMVEMLKLKAPWNYSGNHQVKSIIRPERVKHCYVHCSIYKPGFAM